MIIKVITIALRDAVKGNYSAWHSDELIVYKREDGHCQVIIIPLWGILKDDYDVWYTLML